MTADDFVKRRRPTWQELERLLLDLSSRRKRRQAAPAQLSRFSARFRAVCADLEYARSQGMSDDLVDYLNSLAARSHNIYYVAPPRKKGVVREFFLRTFPLAVRRNALYVGTGLFLFYAPFVAMVALSSFGEDVMYELVPREQLERYEKIYERGHEHGRSESVDAAMTGFYIYNNIGIAFRTFATGLFLGLGSLFFLIYNGVVMGAVLGYLGQSPVAMNLLSFIAGHGPFELTAIALSGAAGLRIGLGVLATGSRSRRASLRLAALDAIKLVTGAAVLLAAAAAIEGFFSPSSLPMVVKFSFGGLCAVFLVFYLGYWPWHLGRQMQDEPHAAR